MTQEQVPQKPDRKDLKIQALINKVTKTENENADYQVELHLRTEELQEAQQEIQNLRVQLSQLQNQQESVDPSEVLDVEAFEVPEPTE
jgi:hypothetical protein